MLGGGFIIVLDAFAALSDVARIAVVAHSIVPRCAVPQFASSVDQIVLLRALAAAQVLKLGASFHHADIPPQLEVVLAGVAHSALVPDTPRLDLLARVPGVQVVPALAGRTPEVIVRYTVLDLAVILLHLERL